MTVHPFSMRFAQTQSKAYTFTPALTGAGLQVFLILFTIALITHAPKAQAQTPAYALSETAKKPVLFAPGIISTDAIEYSPTFSPDGQSIYFTRRASWRDNPALYVSNFANGQWQNAERLPFSGTYKDEYPALSPDGKRLYFASNRPVEGTTPKDRNDIWYVEKTGNGWGAPQHLKAPISTEYIDSHPLVTSDGTLYFHSNRDESQGVDIFTARLKQGQFTDPKPLSVNSKATDGEAAPDPAGKFLIFYSERPGTRGKGDLFVAFRDNDEWTNVSNLGDVINTPEYEWTPTISPDGRYLFYAHLVDSDSDIYQIDIHTLLAPLGH